MEYEDYKNRQVELLNQLAPAIVQLHKINKHAASLLLKHKTGSEYLGKKWLEDQDFTRHYLNSDDTHKRLWLKYLGFEPQTPNDMFIIHQLMLYFNNNNINQIKGMNSERHYKVDSFGCAKNWCKLWTKLEEENKQAIVTYFHN